MSQDRKFIHRPKVRFCQTSESVTEETANTCNQKPDISSSKPRIRSIITLKEPIKLVYKNIELQSNTGNAAGETSCKPESSSVTVQSKAMPDSGKPTDDRNINTKYDVSASKIQNTATNCSANRFSDAQDTIIGNSDSGGTIPKPVDDSKDIVVIYSSSAGNTPKLTHEDSSTESQIPETRGKVASHTVTVPKSSVASNLRNLGGIQKNVASSKISIKPKQKPGVCGTMDKGIASRNAICTSKTVPKQKPTVARTIAKSVPSQNVPCTSKAIPKEKPSVCGTQAKGIASQNVFCTSKVIPKRPLKTMATCRNTVVPKTKAAGKTLPCSSKSAPLKPESTQKIIPCWNQNDPSGKTVFCKPLRLRTKTADPVKKTILRDILGSPTKAFVGPGVPRNDPATFKGPVEIELPHIRPDIISGDKLGRPEYNSIMCTINRLREVQQEKFVTDVEHLPMVYRNFVNGKVSAALDFPPAEAIYKNLVDLSINESQLPSRLTRSKDPEPRQRDLVPKLADFFTPCYSEEYCSAVQVRPRSPEYVNNWSAFAISDKIFGWKDDMDHCH